jgi:L-fuconolactonase
LAFFAVKPVRSMSVNHAVLDSHVHFWDPGELTYPWVEALPRLRRRWAPEHLAGATEGITLGGLIFVECNCDPDQALAEVEMVETLAAEEPRIIGTVAFADLTRPERLDETLDRYQEFGRVRGIRHNIQGNEAGFCLRGQFVEGVRAAGRRGLTFDLCATHDQLPEVVELARRCPQTRLVLDHCGKPAIGAGLLDPWREHIAALAELPNVWCKLSGLLTEADPAGWSEADLIPYAGHVVDRFGSERVMYGGDWPVLTLAGSYRDWYQFTRNFTESWSVEERTAFYGGNALRFYFDR